MAMKSRRTSARRTRVVDEAQKDPTVPVVQYDISSYGADMDVEGLVKRMRREDIYIPKFQRAYVWTLKEASRFIESLLLGLPVPGVFLARDPESKKMFVIDGQQRLRTLQFFYDGFFNPKEDEDTQRVFHLLDVQEPFSGRTYANLRDSDKVVLNDTIIHATIVKQESPPDDDTSIYHIFERLNTSGRKLTPQQIRVAIYPGAAIDVVRESNNYPKWRMIYGPNSPTLKDEELILRFLALYNDLSAYERPMGEFLNVFAKKHRVVDLDFSTRSQGLFRKCIDAMSDSIGTRAFKPERALNAAVFDSVMVGLGRRLEGEARIESESLRNAYTKLLADNDYQAVTSKATSDENSVTTRIRLATEYMSGA